MNPPTPGPLLAALIAADVARWDDFFSDYVATASDGTLVGFGCDPAGIERYLATHPTPDTW
jgi:hypothetical protein